MRKIIAAVRVIIAERRRRAQVELIRVELHSIRYLREYSDNRSQTLYKRLAELGEFVPGYTGAKTVASLHIERHTLAERYPDLAEALRRLDERAAA